MKPAPQHSKPLPQLKPVFSLVLFADAWPDPTGDGFVVKPRPPRSLVFRNEGKDVVQEISTSEACRILNVGRAHIHTLINEDPEGRRRIKWRFTSKSRRRRVFEVESLLDYLEWTKTLED